MCVCIFFFHLVILAGLLLVYDTKSNLEALSKMLNIKWNKNVPPSNSSSLLLWTYNHKRRHSQTLTFGFKMSRFHALGHGRFWLVARNKLVEVPVVKEYDDHKKLNNNNNKTIFKNWFKISHNSLHSLLWFDISKRCCGHPLFQGWLNREFVSKLAL